MWEVVVRREHIFCMDEIIVLFLFMVVKYRGEKGLILADNSRLRSHHFGDITGARA